MRKFVVDFVAVFVMAVLHVAYAVANVLIETVRTMQRFVRNVIVPLFTELCADAQFLLMIMLQAWYDASGRCASKLSGILIRYGKFCVKQSEILIHRTWHHE